jgi:hypothetical protein
MKCDVCAPAQPDPILQVVCSGMYVTLFSGRGPLDGKDHLVDFGDVERDPAYIRCLTGSNAFSKASCRTPGSSRR